MKKRQALCAILLVLILYFSVNLITIPDLRARRNDLAFQVSLTAQLTAKQQKEYEETAAELPQMQAAQAVAEAEAQAATARSDELKARRNILRAEVALLRQIVESMPDT